MSIVAKTVAGVELLQSDACPFSHGFSNRLGGVSTGDRASLDLRCTRGSVTEQVAENFRRLGNAVGFTPEQTAFFGQVHGTEVRSVTRDDRGYGLFRRSCGNCDGMVTDEPGVALVVFGADCPTILLWDGEKRVIAAVHSGWRGTAAGIAREAVRHMTEDYGCKAENIGAAIGPCIGKCCFETTADVPTAMEKALGSAALPHMPQTDPEHWHVDLRAINRIWLEQAGVCRIDVVQHCTACMPEKYWSHRKMGDARGVQAGVIIM